MEPNASLPAEHPGVCPVCHQPVSPSYFFCPNCGAKVHEPPLPTDLMTQVLLYGFSLVLPMICYLAITKWKGIVYLRSKDEKAKEVGACALAILVISSFLTFYFAYTGTEQALQQATDQVNAELGM